MPSSGTSLGLRRSERVWGRAPETRTASLSAQRTSAQGTGRGRAADPCWASGRAGRQLCPGIAAAEELSAAFVFSTDSLSVQGWAVEGRGGATGEPSVSAVEQEPSFLRAHRARWHLLSFSLFFWALFNLKFAPSVSYLIPPTGGKKNLMAPCGSLT